MGSVFVGVGREADWAPWCCGRLGLVRINLGVLWNVTEDNHCANVLVCSYPISSSIWSISDSRSGIVIGLPSQIGVKLEDWCEGYWGMAFSVLGLVVGGCRVNISCRTYSTHF